MTHYYPATSHPVAQSPVKGDMTRGDWGVAAPGRDGRWQRGSHRSPGPRLRHKHCSRTELHHGNHLCIGAQTRATLFPGWKRFCGRKTRDESDKGATWRWDLWRLQWVKRCLLIPVWRGWCSWLPAKSRVGNGRRLFLFLFTPHMHIVVWTGGGSHTGCQTHRQSH